MRYLRTFLLALESEFISRANLLGWFLVGAIPSIVLVLVWFAILGDRPSVNGFTKGDFLIYYTFVTVGWYIVGGTFGVTTGNGIKNGTINTTLLKPYDVVLGQGIQEQAWKVLSIFITFPITAIVLYLFRDIIHIQLTFEQGLLLILSLILGGINFALAEGIVGITAFWVTDMWPVDHIKNILLSLFGGLLVPLALMPPTVLLFANILPFKYMFYVPVSILLSKSSNPVLDVGIQALYIFILFGIYKFIWNLGIRKYEAIGS
jgi:ABC-2 type transport system permease protein